MVLPDGTMVSGDSSGRLQLWDAQHGTLLQAFSQHKADVQALAASTDGNTIFASGIDVQVTMYHHVYGHIISRGHADPEYSRAW